MNEEKKKNILKAGEGVAVGVGAGAGAVLEPLLELAEL
jgi:hypothetical protein